MDKKEIRERVERLIGQGTRVNQTGEAPDDWYVFVLAGDCDDVLALFEAAGLLEDEREMGADPEVLTILKELAQERANDGIGITEEAFKAMPEWYVGHCDKCHKRSVLNKGHVLDYGMFGIYVCQGCGYVYAPGTAPVVIEVGQ